MRILILINQTCTRSTELGFHEILGIWHDGVRNEAPYNTLAQSQQRVNHYYNGKFENYIHVYGSKAVWELAAGRISYSEFIAKTNRKISSRINSTKSNPECFPTYEISLHDITELPVLREEESKHRQTQEYNQICLKYLKIEYPELSPEQLETRLDELKSKNILILNVCANAKPISNDVKLALSEMDKTTKTWQGKLSGGVVGQASIINMNNDGPFATDEAEDAYRTCISSHPDIRGKLVYFRLKNIRFGITPAKIITGDRSIYGDPALKGR